MPRSSLTDVIDRRLSEADPASTERFADLELELEAEDARGQPTGEVIVRVGGRWDRRRKEYVGDAQACRVMAAHPEQAPFLRWFAGWLADHLAGVELPETERVYSVLLAGGQRGGKTWIGVLACVLYAIAVPRSIVWIVCPSDRRYEEVEDLLREIMPAAWYTELGAPWFRWRLLNGSKIVLRSGHKPGALKVGDADFLLVNEAQQQSEKVFAIARGRIAAAGGLVLCAANPPDEPIGAWVGDFATEAQAGMRQAKFFHFDPLDNPHIDHGPLLALAKELDPHTYDVEVRGLFLGAKNAVLHNWSRVENERPTPATGEITREFLKWAERREYDRAVVCDMQRLPHMAAVEVRFFLNPLAPREPERFEWCFLWFTADVTLDGADEFDLCRAWLDMGWDPERTLVVADASGEWQFAERDPVKAQKLRELTGGRGSYAVFRKMGFRHVVPPDRDMARNPDVLERCRATTSRICTKAAGPFGQRFVFSDPKLRQLNKAIRMWKTKAGQPMRQSYYAHRGDVVTYAVHRFFPRRERPAPFRHERGQRLKSAYERELDDIT